MSDIRKSVKPKYYIDSLKYSTANNADAFIIICDKSNIPTEIRISTYNLASYLLKICYIENVNNEWFIYNKKTGIFERIGDGETSLLLKVIYYVAINFSDQNNLPISIGQVILYWTKPRETYIITI